MRYRVSPRVFGLVGVVIIIFRICNRCDDFDVGYQQITVAKGWSFKTITFKAISDTAKYNLSDIICLKADGTEWKTSGSSANKCSGDIRIQKIDSVGNYGTKYSYWSTKDGEGNVWGWCEGSTSGTRATDVAFENGEGMIIQCDKDAGINLQFSGQVTISEGRLIAKGWSFSGNYTPVAVNLSNIKCLKADGTEWKTSGSSANKCSGDIRIQKIDSVGNYGTKYSYWSTKDGEGNVWGWCEGSTSGTRATGVTFAAGEGFIVQCDKDAGIQIVMPSPID